MGNMAVFRTQHVKRLNQNIIKSSAFAQDALFYLVKPPMRHNKSLVGVGLKPRRVKSSLIILSELLTLQGGEAKECIWYHGLHIGSTWKQVEVNPDSFMYTAEASMKYCAYTVTLTKFRSAV